jgi:hypothetical protein
LLLAAGVVAVAGVVAMSQKAGTVYPFAPVQPTAADTLTDEVKTVFCDEGWSVATLTSLCDVEDLLDSLEAQQVAQREVQVMGNSSFRVRWK